MRSWGNKKQFLGFLGFGVKAVVLSTVTCVYLPLLAQQSTQVEFLQNDPQQSSIADPEQAPVFTTDEKWHYFVKETASLLTLGGGTFNAGFSQVTQTDPKYGKNFGALSQRFGASLADIATQNFFGDFVVASALHEDPGYFRKGRGHSFWSRAGYAISRALVIRKDAGGDAFNFDNVLGSALSTGFSNLYYPPASRTGKGMLMHFGIDVADNGFVNLAPEFWPDFRDKVLRRRHRATTARNGNGP